MRYQYYFCSINKPQLVNFLQANVIEYKVTEASKIVPSFVTFNLWSDKEETNLLLKELKDLYCTPMSKKAVFTEAERKNAKWLWLWPKSQSIDIENEDDAYDYSCVNYDSLGEKIIHHEVQKGLIAISREPSPKSRNSFWTESTGFGVLFASKKVFDAVNSGSFEGIDFWNVLKKNGSKCENIFQMRSKQVIGQECIEFGHGEIVDRCPMCGKIQYGISSDYIMHMHFNKIQPEIDFFETERIFGQGIAHPNFIVSQRFYRFLKENKLTGGLDFSPIFPAGSSKD